MATLAIFGVGYRYYEPKLTPNCWPKGTDYFSVCQIPCTFCVKLLEILGPLCLANWLQDRVVVKTYVTKANKVQPFTTVQRTRREGLGLKRDQKIDRERARVGSKRGKFLLFMVTSKTPRQQDKRATF